MLSRPCLGTLRNRLLIAAGSYLGEPMAHATPSRRRQDFCSVDQDQRHGPRMGYVSDMWAPIDSAPYDAELQLAVFDAEGPHALVFPCRRVLGGWANALNGDRIEITPTHWRLWSDTDSVLKKL